MKVDLLSGSRAPRAIPSTAGRDISFAADDWLDAARFHRVVERNRAVHVAMVGHGARLHAQIFKAFRKRFDLNGAVEKAVVGV